MTLKILFSRIKLKLMFLFHSSTKKEPVQLLSLYQTLCVILIIGAKTKVATKFYKNVKQKRFLPNMLLKDFLVKLKYSFQGPIQTDESYYTFVDSSLCVTPQIGHFSKFPLQVLERCPQHAFKGVSCQINICFPRTHEN